MGIQTVYIFLFLSVVQAIKDCRTSYCGNTNGLAINAPFSLEGQQPQKCDSPGFSLSCNGQNKAILNIPYSGKFYVDFIDYYSKIITLSDPENCLPRRLLSLNLSSSPFKAASYQNYTFLSCPRDKVSFTTYAIDCLSNSTTKILAIKYPTEVMQWSMCKEIVTLPIPVSSFNNFKYYFGFPLSLDLTWNESTCTSCSSSSATGSSLRVPVAGIFFISLVVAFVIYCICHCIYMSRQDNRQVSNSIQTSRGASLSNNGTYKTITIGESVLAGPNDATCIICLADYLPKDTITFMTQCEHCFHVECIVKWLTVNVQAIKDCRTSYCGNMNGLAINAPFSLEGRQPQKCDSPGFNLSCNGQNKAILNILYSGKFYVESIYYYIKIITLSDPENCLPRRLLSFNLSSSPFKAASYQNYTFLSCPVDQVSFTTHAIDCLSNSTTKILAIKNPREVIRWSMCKEINTVSIPVSSFYDYGFDYGFPLSLDLTWNESTCTSCSSSSATGILNDDNTD
ncbi:hypothetical protein ACJIZ3_018555 [Penstemon smallii]|uniref:RING-type E3 ubiquitin transferase n=1 Tax=Penstemon smallii TaxID=265156 RepID=A0ABD3SZV9_9LAMI